MPTKKTTAKKTTRAKKGNPAERAAYAAVGAVDVAADMAREQSERLRRSSKQLRRRASDVVDDAERRGRSRVRNIRSTVSKAAKKAKKKNTPSRAGKSKSSARQ
jgi:hypothetical protein